MNIGPTNTKMKIDSLHFAQPLTGIEAFTTLRGSATDNDPYSQFNVCDYTGDDKSHVANCRLNLCSTLGIAPQHLVMPHQTHSADCVIIGEDFLSLSDDAKSSMLDGKDAIITTLSDVAIGVNTADCVPIILADPHKGIIAAVHAGWKGTVKRIAANAIQAMTAHLGANPSNIYAAIGVSICQDCFEVGDEVLEQFADAKFHINHIAYRSSTTGKAHISLQEANKVTLTECGIPQENISICGICTRCNPTTYFSARRIGIKSGRVFTGIVRRSKQRK